MLVGVPREVKTHEYRVGLTPTSVRELAAHGHEVVVERTRAPASAHRMPPTAKPARGSAIRGSEAELVVKVKEPQASERKKLREGQLLFAYLHLAPGSGAGRRPRGKRRGVHRLRDGDQRARRPAAAYADVGGRRPHGRSAWARAASRRSAAAWASCSAACRASAGQDHDPRRGRRRPQRRTHGGGLRRAGLRARPVARCLTRAGSGVRRTRRHRVLEPRRRRAARAVGRPRHRRGARAGRGRAEARLARAGAAT